MAGALFQGRFADPSYRGGGLLGKRGCVPCNFSKTALPGLYGIEVCNQDGKTTLDLHCKMPEKSEINLKEGCTYLAKSGNDYVIGWHQVGCVEGAIPMAAHAEEHISFHITEERLEQTKMARGLREFVESLGLSNETKMKILNALTAAFQALGKTQ